MSLLPFLSLEKQVDLLNQQVDSGRAPHARLLIGNLGSGILSVALGHAAYLLTGDKENQQVHSMNYADLHFSFPFIAQSGVNSSEDFMDKWRTFYNACPYFNLAQWTNNISGDVNKAAIIGKDESEKIVHRLNLKSYLGGKKVLIIWGAEFMHNATANKLLKLIEEPPENTYIVLIAESTEQILQTIISRCQISTIKPSSAIELEQYLIESQQADPITAKNISNLAEGDIANAIQEVHNNEESQLFHEFFVNWMRLCYKKDLPEAIVWAEEVHGLKRERQKRFLKYSLNFFRQCMLERYLGSEHALLFDKEQQFAAKFGKFVHGANVVELMACIDEAYYHIQRNGSAKVIFLDLSVQVIRLLHKTPSLESTMQA